MVPFAPVACLASPMHNSDMHMSHSPSMPLAGHASMNRTSDTMGTRDMAAAHGHDSGTTSQPSPLHRRFLKPLAPLRGSSDSMMVSRATHVHRQSPTDLLSGLTSFNNDLQTQQSNFSKPFVTSRPHLYNLNLAVGTTGNLASQSSSGDAASADFQQSTAYQMTALHTTLAGVNSLFSSAAANDGLANYDKTDQVETTLKSIINTSKNILASANVVIYNLPIVGPILGPSKCYFCLSKCCF